MKWRTSDVLALCQGMRETGDYSFLPILANALQDANYSDDEMLSKLRADNDEWSAQRLVAIIYSDETAKAVSIIDSLAEELGPRAFCDENDGYGEVVATTYDRLMRVGDRWTTPGEWGQNHTVENGSDDLRDGFRDDFFIGFWEAYKAITGKHGEGNPFSCTC
jgi:hypothetical protein